MSALAMLHVAKRDLGLDEETYRSVLERVTGQRSAAKLTEVERLAVVDEFRKQGFKPSSNSSRSRGKPLAGPFAKKLQALWIAGWNLGVVGNRDDRALLAFVKRQTGIDHIRFLRYPEDAAKAIEALKGWLARDGGVDWSRQPDRYTGDYINLPQYRIALAQWQKLRQLDPTHALMLPDGLGGFAQQDWQDLMNRLGSEIRKEPVRR